MRTKTVTLLFSLLLAFGLAGCMDLDVTNLNTPDAARALSNVEGVEGLLAGSYRTFFDATHWNGWGFPSNTLDAMGLVSTGDVGNFGIRHMTEIPRQSIPNSPTWSYTLDIMEGPWYGIYGAISAANDVLNAIEFGAYDAPDMEAEKARATAFARYVQGSAHAFLALYFDRGFVFYEDLDLDAVATGAIELEFQPYTEIYTEAVNMLEAAIAAAEAGPAFLLEDTWLIGNGDIDNAKLARLAHTMLARLHASIGRTPAERAASNWAAVEFHALRGIEEDFLLDTVFPGWYDAYKIIGSISRWSRANYHTLGLADQSGAYQNWLNTPPNNRMPFIVVTDDRRIAGADSVTAPGKYFRYTAATEFLVDRGTYRFSHYPFRRMPNEFGGFEGFGAEGPTPHTYKAENDLLLAEAYYRQNVKNRNDIIEIINDTRVAKGELPPATAANTDAELWEMIKYEKRLECYQGFPGIPWFDARGWTGTNRGNDTNNSDLFIGTALHFPVPARELESFSVDVYTFGPAEGGAATKRNASPYLSPQ
jgi:starch-binding outer membrane protein, SusD/RagB family